MLSTAQLRQVAARSGARDIGNVEIEVILTHLLQLLIERRVMEHLAFKGGTMLRKMIFGPRGRLSTDLDFTCRTDISIDDLTLMLLDALVQSYRGIAFRFGKEKDWYLTDDGCAANPVCSHADNEKGIKIKLQISMRERPILPARVTPQIEQDYFRLLGFAPTDIPCLALEEVIAEKIRAASQRSKVRDLHDLSELAARPMNRPLVRSLAVLKLWYSTGPGLDFETFRTRIQDRDGYDIGELRNLLRKDQEPDLATLIPRVTEGFRFLEQLNEMEVIVARDLSRRCRNEVQELTAALARV